MAWALEQETTDNNQGTSVAPVLASQASNGNVLILVAFTRGSTKWSDATHEYAFSTAVEVQNTTEDDWVSILYRECGASEPADGEYGFTNLGSDSHACWLGEFSGLAASPLDKTASTGRTESTTISTGTTATTSQALELAIAAIGLRASNSVTNWTNSFATEGSAETASPVAHITAGYRGLASAGTVETTATFSSDVALAAVATFKEQATDATPTPTSLAASATFPATTTASEVNASPQTINWGPLTATFPAVTVSASGTATPASLEVLGTIPAPIASGSQDASPTLTALAASATFPAVTAEGIDGVVASLTPLAAVAGFPDAIPLVQQDAQTTLTVLAASGSFPTATAVGTLAGTAVCTALSVSVTFPAVTVDYTWNASPALTSLHVTVAFPAPQAVAADLNHFYNSVVSIAVEVGFVDYPLVASPTWTDITADVRSFSISRGRGSELDEYKSGLLTVVIDNNNGRYDPTSTGALYYPNLLPMKQIRVRASYNFQTWTLFRGFVESWPMQVRGFTDETVTVKAVDGFKVLALQKDSSAQSAENSGSRVGNLLDEAGWPAALRTIGTGVTSVPSLTPDCATILSLIKQVKDSEAGQFYIAADGSATFRNRTYRGGLSPQATFGDSAGDVPYHGIRFSFDDKQIWNRVEVYASGFPSYSSSTASQDKYGIRTLSFLDILLPDTTSADDLADLYRNRYAEPQERIERLDLKPDASPALLWPQVLGRDLSDMVTVKYHTNDSVLKTADSYIEGIQHRVSISPRRWQTTFTLSQFE